MEDLQLLEQEIEQAMQGLRVRENTVQELVDNSPATNIQIDQVMKKYRRRIRS